MNIYPVSIKLKEIEDYLIELDGELPEDEEESILEQLTIRRENFNTELLEYLHFIKNLEAQIAFAESEIKRITKFKQLKENLLNRLEKVVKESVIHFGNKDPKKDLWRYEVGTFKLNTRTSQSVEVDMETIPDEFKRVAVQNLNFEEYVLIADTLGKELKASFDVLKTPIKEKILQGEHIEGAELKTNIGIQIK